MTDFETAVGTWMNVRLLAMTLADSKISDAEWERARCDYLETGGDLAVLGATMEPLEYLRADDEAAARLKGLLDAISSGGIET